MVTYAERIKFAVINDPASSDSAYRILEEINDIYSKKQTEMNKAKYNSPERKILEKEWKLLRVELDAAEAMWEHRTELV